MSRCEGCPLSQAINPDNFFDRECSVKIPPSKKYTIPEDFCPIELGWTAKTLREICHWHHDGNLETDPNAKGWCLVHLANGDISHCRLISFGAIMADPDYQITEQSLFSRFGCTVGDTGLEPVASSTSMRRSTN